MILRRFIGPQQDALAVEEFTCQTEIEERRLTELIDRITHFVELLGTVQLRASILQDFLSVRFAERLNRTMLRLSVVAGVFPPLTFVSGLFGMNVAGIPGASAPQTLGLIPVALILAGVVELMVIRRLRLL